MNYPEIWDDERPSFDDCVRAFDDTGEPFMVDCGSEGEHALVAEADGKKVAIVIQRNGWVRATAL